MTDEPGFWLISAGLLSKWGFDDGSLPDGYLDWLDDQGLDYPDDDTEILRTLVRTRLVPALDQRVELVEIETSHNPIRATTVDGVDVEECWYGRQEEPTLTPDAVFVPYRDVHAVAERANKEGAAA
jgi:hypothetical protein